MKHLLIVIISFWAFYNVNAQIVIDNNPPYDNPTWLIDNILLGGGVVASNHAYQGETVQIGWFNAINTNLGIDSGIVMACGDIYLLDPNNAGIGGLLPNTVTDPDLLGVANSVPGLIGQSFSVSSIGDVAVLEFDFVPTSDSLEFRYAFGSQEYFAWENSSYNDVFGFFLSGPGIAGPYSSPPAYPNGSVNLAIVPSTNPPLPITISSINSVTPINQQYFVDNQSGLNIIADANGFTTVLTASAFVECGETYHIRLAIADGSDQSLNSYVWLEAGSFSSPPLNIADNLGIDSAYMSIPCNSTVVLTANGGSGATYQWSDNSSVVFSTDSSVTVGDGTYVVSADILGCAVLSDTLTVVEGDFPTFSFGPDLMIPCNSDTIINPVVSGGTTPYSYLWNTGQSDSMLTLGLGNYQLTVTDLYGCSGSDDLDINYDVAPSVNLGTDFNIPCNTTSLVAPIVVGGTAPYSFMWNTGDVSSSLDLPEGNYQLTVTDIYGCSGLDDLEITYDAIPTADVFGGDSICDDGSMININFNFNGLLPWDLVFTDGNINYTATNILSSNYTHITNSAGSYEIVQADDLNNCIASNSGIADIIVNPLPVAVITPSEVTVYENETVELTAGTYIFYEWYTVNDSLVSNEEILTVSDPGSFYIWVQDENGCEAISEVAIVNVVPITQLFIPNSFTPNDDEHNELFVIKGMNVVTFNIRIFDRWGEQLFESDSIYKYWDGKFNTKKVQQGAYYYNIEVLGKDKQMFKKSGEIKVIY
jgi:gliding motility-associated-like protein